MSALEKSHESIQGVLVQEISEARAVQKVEGETDVDLASGVMRVLLVTLDVGDPFTDQASKEKASAVEPESVDIWLVLEIGNNFSLPVQATQTVLPQRSDNSYTFPSSEISGAGITLYLSSSQQSNIEQFEELLTDYCAFQTGSKGHGSIELMDEKGEIMGTIDGPWHLEEDAGMHKPGYEKDPVLVELPSEGTSIVNQKITVSTAPRAEDGTISSAYQNDWLLRGASLVSKTLTGTSAWAGKKMLDAAESYVAKTTPPPSRPGEMVDEKFSTKDSDNLSQLTTSGRPAMTFSPKVHATSQQLRAFSGTATKVSTRTRDAVLGVAGGLGDKIGRTTGIQSKPRVDGTAEKPKGIRGVLNRSLVAANVVLDGITQSAGTLIADGGEASGRVIEHRYGSEAKVISGNTASLGKSAFVIYKDINGVRRKALLKIATGTIKARAPDGSEVILQQEGTHLAPAEGHLTSSEAGLPSYTRDSKLEKR